MSSQKQRKRENNTYLLRQEDVKRSWFIFDAAGKTLGRFASEVARILMGKHKPTYSTFIDGGDGIIVINAEKIKVTGAKAAQKVYRYHTGFVKGLRETPFRVMQDRKPEFIIEHAVKGMVPRNTQGRAQMKRLRIFAGKEHKMNAQNPIEVNI